MNIRLIVLLFALLLSFVANAEKPGLAPTVLKNLIEIGLSDKIAYSWSTAHGDWREKGPTGFHQKTGDDPVLTFYEFSRVVGQWFGREFYDKYRPLARQQIQREFREHHTIPLVTWHLENPYVPDDFNKKNGGSWFIRGSEDFPECHTNIVREIVTGGGSECGGATALGHPPARRFKNPKAWYDAMLRSMAEFCKTLTDDRGRRIPVIFRLFHEFDGGWFWWGDKDTTRKDLIALFRYSIDFLRRELGAENVLFCYGPDRWWSGEGVPGLKGGYLSAYPGDDYVDILGFDDYAFGTGETEDKKRINYQATVERMRTISKIGRKRHKACAIFECSADKHTTFYRELYDAVHESGVEFAFVTTYDAHWTFPSNERGMDDLRRFLARKDVLTAKQDIDLTVPMAVSAMVRHEKASSSRTLSLEEYRDKMKAGWIGQMVGVSWGQPTEFIHYDAMLTEAEVPVWTSDLPVKLAYGNDDLYVEMTFMRSLLDYGLDVSSRQAGIDFANSRYQLWCANRCGRINLRKGIAPPDCTNPKLHTSPNDIDYQIESDYAGLISPGCPQEVVRLGNVFGRLVNFGDGVWAGQFVGAMYSEAFFTQDVDKLLDAGLRVIPAESDYAAMVRDVRMWHREFPDDWTQCWTRIRDRYSKRFNPSIRDSNGGIDVRLNGACIVLGLLYGKGDLENSMRLAMRCGWDSDCNPSNVGGILFATRGIKAIPAKWIEKIDYERKFAYSDFNLTSLFAASEKLAREIVRRNGGSILRDSFGTETFVIPSRPAKPDPYIPSWNAGEPEGVRYTEDEMKQQKFALKLPDPRTLRLDNPTECVQKSLDALYGEGWKTTTNGLHAGYRECEDTTEGQLYGIIWTVPPDAKTPVVLSRVFAVPRGDPKLHFKTAPLGRNGLCQLEVRVDGELVLERKLPEAGTKLDYRACIYTFDIPFDRWSGKKVKVELVNRPLTPDRSAQLWYELCLTANMAAVEENGRASNLSVEALGPKSVAVEGNYARLERLCVRAERGETLQLVAIGGSITQGAGASSASRNWVNRFAGKWQQLFPRSKLKVYNAGIGATGSDIGAFRTASDVIAKKPDLVVVEFSVNDQNNRKYAESYEGIVRQVLLSSQETALLLLGMTDPKGNSAQEWHEKVARHYQVPFVSYRDAVWPLLKDKTIDWKDVSPDSIHPNDLGHDFAAGLLAWTVERAKKAFESTGKEMHDVPALPQPLFGTTFDSGKVVWVNDAKILSNKGFFELRDGFWGNGLACTNANCSIKMEVEGATAALLYRYGSKPYAWGYMRIKVDGQTVAPEVDCYAGFSWWWTPSLIVYRDRPGKHVIEVEALPKKNPLSSGYGCQLTGLLLSK